MNTLKSKFSITSQWKAPITVACIMLLAHLLWQTLPILLHDVSPTVGLMDNGVWQLLLFAIICFLFMLTLCIMLLKWLLGSLALPPILKMVSQFNHLTPWQQISFCWASFALLFLGALLSLCAIF